MRNELIAIAIAIAFPLGVMAATANPAASASAPGTIGAATAPGAPGPGGGTPGSLGSVGTTGSSAAIGTGQPRATQSPAVTTSSESLWRQLDVDKNGVISRDEARELPTINSRFNQLDRDSDGVLTPEELSAGVRASGRSRPLAR